MLYPSRTYFKQYESFRDFLHFMTHFLFEIYTEQFAPMYTWWIYLWRYDVGDSQPFVYNSSFRWTRLQEYNFRFQLVTLCHIMWVYFTVLQMPICNLFGSTSFGYLYYIQIYIDPCFFTFLQDCNGIAFLHFWPIIFPFINEQKNVTHYQHSLLMKFSSYL